MQVLKDDVRNSILNAAVDEFHENGFKDASIRKIAHAAGTTPGNIYAYFSSKRNLFEEILSQIVSVMNDTVQNFLLNKNPRDISVEMLTDKITVVFFGYRKQFMILMNGSNGTKYENYRSDFCDLIAQRLLRDYPDMRGDTAPNDLALHAFSYALMEGVFYIFNRYQGNETEIRDALTQLLAFLFKNLRRQ